MISGFGGRRLIHWATGARARFPHSTAKGECVNRLEVFDPSLLRGPRALRAAIDRPSAGEALPLHFAMWHWWLAHQWGASPPFCYGGHARCARQSTDLPKGYVALASVLT